MAEYTEACCFNDPRDHCIGDQCRCGCHAGAPRVTRRAWESIKIADFDRLEARIIYLERLLDRAYPLLHNPSTQQTDPRLAITYDTIIREVEIAMQHRKEEDDPERVNLPSASCDGVGGIFEHAPSCWSDFCVGNGDTYACNGTWSPCPNCDPVGAAADTLLARRGAVATATLEAR